MPIPLMDAARRLHIDIKTLRRRLDKAGITPETDPTDRRSSTITEAEFVSIGGILPSSGPKKVGRSHQMPTNAPTIALESPTIPASHPTIPATPTTHSAPAQTQEAILARLEHIEAQNDRIEQALRTMHARLDEMTASPTLPTVEGSLRELLPRERQKQVRGPAPGSGVPSDLPTGTVTFEEFCRLTGVNNGTMKSRINKTDNEKIRLETTTRLGADRRNHHFLTPEQQRKALLQWHLYGPDHLEHPLCPEAHQQTGEK
jgi:hypothetical protein